MTFFDQLGLVLLLVQMGLIAGLVVLYVRWVTKDWE